MTKQDQIKFVQNLCDSVKLEIQSKIEGGKIPDNWDGIELRMFVAEKFKNEVIGNCSQTRKRAYNNTVLVNNL